MTRDEFLAGANDDTHAAPGRSLFLVAIDSQGHQTEDMLRRALFDYFGSLASGVRQFDVRLSTDQVVPFRPRGSASVDNG